MRSRDAWLAVFAAALGVSEDACKREGKDAPPAVHDVPSATTSAIVAAAAPPSASAEPAPSASAVASASAAPSASAVASAKPVPKPSELQLLGISNAACGAVVPRNDLQNLQQIGRVNPSCGATANPETVRGPIAEVQVHVQNGAAGDDRVVVSLRARFRTCANNGLKQDPTMQGKLVISASIAANGEVTTTSIAQNTGLSEPVAQCMSHGVRNATFPAGAARTVQIVVNQSKQN